MHITIDTYHNSFIGKYSYVIYCGKCEIFIDSEENGHFFERELAAYSAAVERLRVEMIAKTGQADV